MDAIKYGSMSPIIIRRNFMDIDNSILTKCNVIMSNKVSNNNKESMIIFEELVDFRNSKMINHFKFMNLFFKE